MDLSGSWPLRETEESTKSTCFEAVQSVTPRKSLLYERIAGTHLIVPESSGR